MIDRDDADATQSDEPRTMPLLPLRDIIVFPHMSVPLFVGRPRSIAAVEKAVAGDKHLILAAQKRAKTNEPSLEDIFPSGTIAEILHFMRLPDGTVKILVKGQQRARIVELATDEPCMIVTATPIVEMTELNADIEALVRQVREAFDTYVKLSKRVPGELLISLGSIGEPSIIADTIAGAMPLRLSDKQALLEMGAPEERMQRLLELLTGEIEILQAEKKLRTKVRKQMEKRERDQQQTDQMQSLQQGHGEQDEFKNELVELEEKIAAKKMSKEAKSRAQKEWKKLKQMSPMSAEATVIRNYIDWVLALPWEDKTDDRLDIPTAQTILDEDHYGLAKIKERIIEYLAVQALVKKIRGPILCLVGPPGVGKTSLAKSIAKATGRKFVRLALGGVRDEAEVRGHRRTYIGALPGKILQCLRKAGSNNPVFLLDEIDKMSSDFRGDPSAALLEVLDPEQNTTFNDHYLDLDYDLSDVLFITTANNLHSIPVPLQDRMEIIQLPGYTEWEKVAIAEHHLIPKTKGENGVANIDVEINEATIRAIITQYTKEAGVRSLEREISTVFRKVAREVVGAQSTGEHQSFKVTPRNLARYLGPHKFRAGRVEEHDAIGMVNGLAVTMHGGDILPSEVMIVPGRGKLVLTGKLGDVMQESAQAALSYVRSRAQWLGLDREFYTKIDIHVHFPEGAIPKDGPSAGVTMATALVSALLRLPVRRDVAMTGEITLRGRVLPIGGLKDKVLAAHRAGISTVVMPKENRKDLQDIPAKVLKTVKIVAVDHMDEVLKVALKLEPQGPSTAVDWRDQDGAPPVAAPVETH